MSISESGRVPEIMRRRFALRNESHPSGTNRTTILRTLRTDERVLMHLLESNPSAAKNSFAENRAAYARRDEFPTTPILIADEIEDVALRTMTTTPIHSAHLFISRVDYALGIGHVAAGVKLTTAYLHGHGDDITRNMLDATCEMGISRLSEPQEMDRYRKILELLGRYGEKLKADPSGRTLVQTIIEGVREEITGATQQNIRYMVEAFQDPEFVLNGALYGQHLYESFYSLLADQPHTP